MHPNAAFRRVDDARNIAFARARSFGVLAVNGELAPLLSHIPFLLSKDGKRLEAHLVRSNPMVRMLDQPRSAVMAVTGPDGYISPDWYGVEDQVPTWNYVAVHLRGRLRCLPADDLRGVLERVSQEMETRLLPKPIWALDKISDETYAKLSRMIVPVFMDVEQIDSTWKLAQNKPQEAIIGAAAGLEQAGIGVMAAQLAQLMREPPC